ncbi:GapA-binding peptide SR1P [Virgibacillus oceani]|nr:GapA-binding peptide SR1P [Virgibacillus oceani]
MGTIICQDCQQVIEHFDDEKVTTLYGTCPSCEK